MTVIGVSAVRSPPMTVQTAASEQIRWWLSRGYTAQLAWDALGIGGRARGGWPAVRAFMERWMIEREG